MVSTNRILTLLLTSTTGFAQLPTETLSDTYLLDLAPGVEYLTSAHGDFDGNGIQDIAVTAPGGFDVRLAPGVFDVRMVNVGTASDLVACPNGAGYQDILAVNSSGLVRYDWNGNGWDATVLSGSWSDVTRLRSIQVGTGFYVVGHQDGVASLHTAKVSPGPLQEAIHPLGLQDDIDDFELIQWNGSGTPEIALVYSGTLDVRTWSDPTVVVASQTASGYDDGVLERLKHGSGQWLAWLGTASNGSTQTLAVVGPSGFEYIEVLGSGLDAYAMVAADCSGDGKDDLLFQARDSFDPGLLINVGNSGHPEFNINQPITPGQSQSVLGIRQRLDTGVPGLANGAQSVGVVCDLDNDGDLDYALPISAVDALWVGKEDRVVDEELCAPSLVLTPPQGTTHDVGVRLDGCDMEWIPAHNRYEGEVLVSFNIEEPQAILTGADTLEVLTWVIDMNQGAIEQTPLDVVRRPLQFTAGYSHEIVIPVETSTVDSDGVGMTQVLIVLARTIEYDAVAETVLTKYPAHLFGMEALQDSVEGNPNAALVLGAFDEPFSVFATHDANCTESAGGDDDGTGTGGGGTIPCSNNSPPTGG